MLKSTKIPILTRAAKFIIVIVACGFFAFASPASETYRSLDVMMKDGTHMNIALLPDMGLTCDSIGSVRIRMGKNNFTFQAGSISHFTFTDAPGHLTDPNHPEQNVTEYTSLDVMMKDGSHTLIALYPEMRLYFDEEGNLIISNYTAEFNFLPESISNFTFSTEKGLHVPVGIQQITGDNGSTETFCFDGSRVLISSDQTAPLHAKAYSIEGLFINQYEGNPIEVNTTFWQTGTYIISTSKNSFKFIVKRNI